MEQNPSTGRSLVLSYLGVRKAIGIIGFLLPFVLALGKMMIDGMGIESSISTYYYSGMRDVFVGAMCAIGVFLYSYRGHDYRDEIAGKFAAICAIGLALFPAAPDLSTIPQERFIGTIHLALASGFFSMLVYFCLFLFTKTSHAVMPTQRKLQRNRVYRVCGAFIVMALVLIVIVKQFPEQSDFMRFNPIFWLESVAVVAFGVSWLAKGEAFLKDLPGQADAPLIPGQGDLDHESSA